MYQTTSNIGRDWFLVDFRHLASMWSAVGKVFPQAPEGRGQGKILRRPRRGVKFCHVNHHMQTSWVAVCLAGYSYVAPSVAGGRAGSQTLASMPWKGE